MYWDAMTEAAASAGLAAVLFDMDGTLLDSEKIWDVALDDLAAWLGGELSLTARHRMVGSSLGRSVAILHADLGIEADPESSGALPDRAHRGVVRAPTSCGSPARRNCSRRCTLRACPRRW